MMKDSLVIFLHGVGSRGADLAPLAQLWAGTLPHAAFEAPDAPHPFDGGGNGCQWFSVAGVTEANRPARVEAARPGFDAVVAALMDRHGLAGRPDRVAFVGFSQGSIMALDAVASGRWNVAAVAAFSGRLPAGVSDHPAADTNVLLIHGAADRVLPATEAVRAEALFTRAGVQAEARVIAGLGHTISQEGAVLAGEFLAERLG
ncbi:MAG: dienelactone hydrolase family protein [Paracoccaceae bacterium]